MLNFLIVLGTVLLLLLCVPIVLIILMQRASANAGMGSALGGGAAESALGGAAGNVLTKLTIWGMGIFFVMCFLLYLGQIGANQDQMRKSAAGLESIEERLMEEAAAEEAAAAAAAEAEEGSPLDSLKIQPVDEAGSNADGAEEAPAQFPLLLPEAEAEEGQLPPLEDIQPESLPEAADSESTETEPAVEAPVEKPAGN